MMSASASNVEEPLAASAALYCRKGLSVIPCCWPTPDGRCGCRRGHQDHDIGKRPLVDWKTYQEGPAHADQIDEWWTRWPEANIGIVTGAVSGIVVIDADGPKGLASLQSLGPISTWVSKTGREEGGLHVFFRHPGPDVRISNTAGRLPRLPGIDVRGDGGYVIVPPSRHRSGRAYAWVMGPWQ